MTDILLTPEIHQEAIEAAQLAAHEFFEEELGGEDRFACGFAWVKATVKGNTKVGKSFIAQGFRKGYPKGYELWNPGGHHCQNVDTKEVGAAAYVKVLQNHGLGQYVYPGSRLD